MIELIIGFFLGYSVGKALGSLSTLRKPDKILTWSPECLGYRPVPLSSKVKAGERYLICYEVQSGNKKG